MSNKKNKKYYKPNNNKKEDQNSKPDEVKDSERELNGKSSTNDIGWYSKYPELIASASQIDYSYPTGALIPAIDDEAVPGFARIDVIPDIPATETTSDPVNASGVNTYLFINKGKSNRRPYDPVDLTKLEIATAHFFAFVNFLQRVYAIVFSWTPFNKYLARAFVEAMGIDYDKLVRNLANFRMGINQLVTRAAALILPSSSDVPYYAREAFLFRDIYKESDSLKDQMYFMHPYGFYVWDLAESGNLVLTKGPWYDPETLVDIDTLLSYGESMLNSFLGDTDVATMCADILNAYGDNVIRLSLLPEDVRIVPVYDPVVLEQIMNADVIDTVFAGVNTNATWLLNSIMSSDITTQGTAGENPYLQTLMEFTIGKDWTGETESTYRSIFRHYENEYRMLHTHSSNPGMVDTIENSRLMVNLHTRLTGSGQHPVVTLDNWGCDLVYRIRMYRFASNGGGTHLVSKLWSSQIAIETRLGSHRSPYYYMDILDTASKFSFLPKAYVTEVETINNGAAVDGYTNLGYFGEIANYGNLPKRTLSNINVACAFSLFALPMSAV